jgi:hypothetical protein
MADASTLGRKLSGTIDPQTRALIEQTKRAAKEASLDPNNLPDAVGGPEERRCPFLSVMSGFDANGEPTDDAHEVDGLCDVRVQTFVEFPPYGPKDLKVCELCLVAKQFQMNEAQAEVAEEQFEKMARAAKSAPPKDTSHYG